MSPSWDKCGGGKPRVLLNRVVVGRLCHTVLAPSEPSKASLGREMLYARAAGGGMQVLGLFSERKEFIGNSPGTHREKEL